jgi:hypothetical protein
MPLLVILSVAKRGRRIVANLLLAALALSGIAHADVAELDANARAAGNLKRLAIAMGDKVFATEWPAQVTQVAADGVSGHVVIGVRISGVKFHGQLTRAGFLNEVDRIVALVFASAANAEEVDVWATVPIPVRKGAIVSGAYAVPTTRPVFTIAVRRGRDPASATVFWDEEWARSAFKQGP